MRALFLHIKRNGSLDGQYGMSNLDEFVAEAFSNPKFQAALKDIPAPKSSTLRNAWEWFVRLVANALGFKTAPMRTALDEVNDCRRGADAGECGAEWADGRERPIRPRLARHSRTFGRLNLDSRTDGRDSTRWVLEGAQAYGWGGSADSRDVATSYIGGKSGHIKEPLIGGKRIDELSPQLLRKWEMDTGGKSYAF